MPPADPNVIPDDVLAAHGLPPRSTWTPGEWDAFLAGWSRQRLGYPGYPRSFIEGPMALHGHKLFAFGVREAEHFGRVA